MDNDFGHLKEVVTQGRRVVNNIQRTAILFLMKTFCISLLAFLLIPFQKGQSEFTIENIYLMQTGIIAIGGLMLSVETSNKPLTGSFKTTVYSRALASGLFMSLRPSPSVKSPRVSAWNVRSRSTARPLPRLKSSRLAK
jgi:Cation transport ATPase